jgi:DNA polymerase/3'-5' exonuclease PolX
MSTGPKIPLSKAYSVANRFLKLIDPYVEKAEIAGSVRRKCKMVGDIEIVCVENHFNGLDNIFHAEYPGIVVNGSRLKRFKYPKDRIQIELYIAQPYDYGRILAIRTGSSSFSHIKLAITWNRLGWCGTEQGLRRKKECDKKGSRWVLKPEYQKTNCIKPPVFDTEADFFEFLQIPWIPPEQRNWTSEHNNLNYST